MQHLNIILIMLVIIINSACIAKEYADDLLIVQSERSRISATDMKALDAQRQLDSRQPSGIATEPGHIEFAYGMGIPTVVCAVLELTDIALEKGEHIKSVQLGDTSRWSLDSIVSGTDENAVEHLIIKPLDTALTTSLIIATDKRSYHIRVKSSLDEFMPLVSFTYKKERNELLKDSSYTLSASLSFSDHSSENRSHRSRNYGYEFSGDSSLIPLNTFDDGFKTYIQLNDTYICESLPSVMEVSDDGALFFAKENLSAVNYTFTDSTFIIEGVYSHLRLSVVKGSVCSQADIRRVS